LLVITIVFFSNVLSAQDSLDKLIPGKDSIWNWAIKKPVTTYSKGNLYSLIPDETDLFIEYGFEKAITCTYRNAMANTIRIDVFKMTSSGAAFGIYGFKALPGKKIIELGDESALYDYYIDVWKGSYYYRVTASNKNYGMIDTVLLFADYVNKRINEKGVKPFLASLLEDSPDYKSVKYFKGIVALDRIYRFGHGSVAGFEEGVAGKKDRSILFVIGYRDFRTAREWIAAGKGKLRHYDDIYSSFQLHDNGWSIKDKTGTPVSFLPYDKYLLVIKGKEWDEAVKDFEKVKKLFDLNNRH